MNAITPNIVAANDAPVLRLIDGLLAMGEHRLATLDDIRTTHSLGLLSVKSTAELWQMHQEAERHVWQAEERFDRTPFGSNALSAAQAVVEHARAQREAVRKVLHNRLTDLLGSIDPREFVEAVA